jgi:hypothetical protein
MIHILINKNTIYNILHFNLNLVEEILINQIIILQGGLQILVNQRTIKQKELIISA